MFRASSQGPLSGRSRAFRPRSVDEDGVSLLVPWPPGSGGRTCAQVPQPACTWGTHLRGNPGHSGEQNVGTHPAVPRPCHSHAYHFRLGDRADEEKGHGARGEWWLPALGGSPRLNGCPLPAPVLQQDQALVGAGFRGAPGEGHRARAGRPLWVPACPAPRLALLARAWARHRHHIQLRFLPRRCWGHGVPLVPGQAAVRPPSPARTCSSSS